MTLTTPPRRTVLQVGFAAASVAVVTHACSDNEKEPAEEVTPPELKRVALRRASCAQESGRLKGGLAP